MDDPVTGMPDEGTNAELTGAQKIEKLLCELGVDANVSETGPEHDKTFVIETGVLEQNAIGASFDVYKNEISPAEYRGDGGAEFFGQGTVSRDMSDRDLTSHNPVLTFSEGRMAEIDALLNDQESINWLKESVEMQVNTVPDGDINFHKQNDCGLGKDNAVPTPTETLKPNW